MVKGHSHFQRLAVSANLIIVAGHSPYEERLLILRIDDPKFFDCRFQR